MPFSPQRVVSIVILMMLVVGIWLKLEPNEEMGPYMAFDIQERWGSRGEIVGATDIFMLLR